MKWEGLWFLSPLGLALVMWLVWWFVSWANQRHRAEAERAGFLGFLVICSRLFLLAAIVVLVVLAGFVGVIPGFVLAVVLIASTVRYWRSEVRYLIWNLSEAAKRQIPLETVARSFAIERSGLLATRARSLADYLDAAMPLSLALSRSNLSVPPDIRLAADVGQRTGTLSQALKKTLQQRDVFDRVKGGVLIRFFYLLWVLLMAVFVLSFMMLKIVPTFEKIFSEFGMQLPAMTGLLIEVTRIAGNFALLWVPVFSLLVAGAVLALLSYLGFSLRGVPLIGRMFSTIDNASVLRMLSVSVREKRPLVGSLELLAAYSPISRSRSRLYKAIRQLVDGAHWCDALQHARLVSRAQAAVFKSAERAGNLAWALEEMADSSVRHASLRAEALLNVLFPGAILVFGLGIMFVAVALMLPLFQLIVQLI